MVRSADRVSLPAPTRRRGRGRLHLAAAAKVGDGTDPATWRDLVWMLLNPWLGAALAGGSAAAIVYGVFGMALPHGSTQLAGVISHPLYGILLAASGFWAAPWLLRGYGGFARSLLGPTRQAQLAQRVSHLAQTRSDAIDTGAAEMRRVERDLHDGAQARLVALGMTLDAAGQLIDINPAAARALLAEARDNSVKALAELRDLVRGIHPPVLADRGLADAVRALALDSPLRCRVTTELPGRAPAPVESAAYFAVSELLANVAKHADARQGVDRHRYEARATADTRRAADRRHRRRLAAAPTRPAAPGCPASSAAWRRSTGSLAVSSPLRRPDRGEHGDPVRVVIAEDLFLLRDGLTRMLEAHGLEVTAAVDNPADLLAAVTAQQAGRGGGRRPAAAHLHRRGPARGARRAA